LFEELAPVPLGIINAVAVGTVTVRVRPVRFLATTFRILAPEGSESVFVFTTKVDEARVTVPTYLRVTNCVLADARVVPDTLI